MSCSAYILFMCEKLSQMVKDRVEQYQKEGKYVLGQSNDLTIQQVRNTM